MNDRVEVLVPDGRQDLEPDAVILQLPGRNVVRAAIDRHFMTARRETSREVLGECFEPAIAGWNTSSSENSDPH